MADCETKSSPPFPAKNSACVIKPTVKKSDIIDADVVSEDDAIVCCLSVSILRKMSNKRCRD